MKYVLLLAVTVAALAFSPETKGTVFTADLMEQVDRPLAVRAISTAAAAITS